MTLRRPGRRGVLSTACAITLCWGAACGRDAPARTGDHEASWLPDGPRDCFLPGDRELWASGLSDYDPAMLPPGLELVEGQLDIALKGARHYLRSADGAVLKVHLPEALPPRFSVEIEYHAPAATAPFLFEADSDEAADSCAFGSLGHDSFVQCGPERRSVRADLPAGGSLHVRFTLDERNVSAYINEQPLPPLPRAEWPRGKSLRIHVPGGDPGNPTHVSAIRVAAGGRPCPW